MTQRFAGKIAMVTGAGSGIGKAVALRFAEEGAQVFAVSRSKNVFATAELHTSITPCQADIGQEDQVIRAFAECRAKLGLVRVLCNNAAMSIIEGRLHETKLETCDKVWDVNIRGNLQVLQLAIKDMLEGGKGGAIVNMASIGSFRASVGSGPYIISKGALLMMTRQAAIEYAQDGIRVNSVHPGLIATEMVRVRDPALLAPKIAVTPAGRMGTSEEVASLTAYLCSDEASYISGGAYSIDGARSAQ